MNEPRSNPSLPAPSTGSGPWPCAFTHPGYWAALALLLLNDHVLKGAGFPFAPAWLTGKLSDFAGLLVAPPLVALVMAVCSPRRGAIRPPFAAPLLVGMGFAAMKLEPSAAQAVEAALGVLGFPSRIWVDPTDLVALAVLPIASMLCRPAVLEASRLRVPVRVPVIAIAAFACIATAGSDDEGGSASEIPELVNETGETLIVHIASTNGAGGCPIYREDRVGVLTPDAFALRREVVLKKGERASLSGDLSVEPNKECGAAWVTLPDGRQQLVYWADLDAIESFVSDSDAKRVARRVTLRGQTNRFRFEIGEDLRGFELSGDPIETNCRGRVPEHTVEATALALAPGFYTVDAIAADDDGCLVIDWATQASDPVTDTQRLCIPEWAFPFEVHETLSVIEELRDNGARRLRITRFDEENRLNQQLTIWNDTDEIWDGHAKKLLAEDCVGAITQCGAYSRPVQVELPGDDGVIVAGDEADLRDGNDEVRLLVGDGREIGWSSAACSDREARSGIRINLLELRTD